MLNLMKKILSIFSLSLLLLIGILENSIVIASEFIQARFAGVTLNLPYPNNLCLVNSGAGGGEGPSFNLQKDYQRSVGNKLLAFWVDCNSHKKFQDNVNAFDLDEWFILVGSLSGDPLKEKIFPKISQKSFLKMMLKQFGKLDLDEITENANKNLHSVVPKYLGESSSVTVRDPIDLGVIAVTDSIHKGIILNVQSKVEGMDPNVTVAGVFSSALVNGVFIHYYFYLPYKNKDTIKKLLTKAKYYSAKLTYANVQGTPTVIANKYLPLTVCEDSPLMGSISKISSWNNCRGAITLNNGNKYDGEWKNGMPDGNVTSTFASGRKYVGEYKEGKQNGQGTTTYSSPHKNAGSKYVGRYKDGKRHGNFTVTYANGNKYVGEFKDDKKNGKGTAKYIDGQINEGFWKDGNFLYAQKGTPPVIAKKHSPLMKCVGSPLTGSISKTSLWNNCRGAMTLNNGNKYDGEWKNGMPDGNVTSTFASGSKYVGEYKEGKKNGQGTYTFSNGDKYTGGFKDGKYHGLGTETFDKGLKYVGEYRDDKRNGNFIVKYANGNKYVGEYKDGKKNGQGTVTFADGLIKQGTWKDGKFLNFQKGTPTVIARKSLPSSPSAAEVENKRLQKRIAELEKEQQSKPNSNFTGSGFFVSKLGYLITNEHVVRDCNRISVGDSKEKQVSVDLVETDKRNDLALLQILSTQMATIKTKSLIRKLGMSIVPLSSQGLLRSDDVELGEKILVAGFPYGDIFSDTIKVTGGMVSANKGMGDDSGQFQIDAAVQPGNSGGPIYDENGNIVGVVVAQLNKRKLEKAIGSIPENVNFGIKGSTVRQFLTSSGLPTKWSNRTDKMSTKKIAKIGKNQTVMVMCHR